MSSSKSKGGEQRKRESSPERKSNNKDNTPKKSLDDSEEDKDKNSGDIRRSSRPQKRKLLDQDFFESDLAAKKPKLNHPSSPTTTPSKKSSKSSKKSSSKSNKKSSSKNKSKDESSSSSSSNSSSSKSSDSSSESSSSSEDDEKSSKSSASSSESDSDDEKSSASSKSSKSSSSSRSSKSSKSSSSSASSKSSKSSSSSSKSKSSSKNSKSKDESSEESDNEDTQTKQPLVRMFWTESEERALIDALRKGPFISFQKILDEIKDAFHPSRTAKSLEAHFYRMKRKGIVDRDIPLENLPKPSKVKRQSFNSFKGTPRRKSEPRNRKPRPKKAKNNNNEDKKSDKSDEESGESGEEKSAGKEEKSKEDNKSKSKSDKSKEKTPIKKKNDNNKQKSTKSSEKKSSSATSDKKSTPAKKDSPTKASQQKKDSEKTPQKKDQNNVLKKSSDSSKKSTATTPKTNTDSNKKTASRTNSNVSRQSVEDSAQKDENSAQKSTDNTTSTVTSPTPMPFKKVIKDYSKAHRAKKAEEKSISGPTSATEEPNNITNSNKVSSPPTAPRTPSSRTRKDKHSSAEESSPVLSPMQPQVRSKRISERRERQLKEGMSESNSFRHADYIDSSLISTPPSAPETVPLPEDDTSNSAMNNSAMEIDQYDDGRSPKQPNPVKKSRSAGSSDKFFEFETACLEEAIRNQAQFEHFITSIDTVDATLAKIDYSIKEIQTLQNIQKLEREIERALDMHGIRDSSLALLRGFHLRYTMKTQKIILGRPTANNTVDVNLLDENSEDGNKISRRQALIKLKYDGEFYIKNLGSRDLYVNGELVRTGNRKRLSHNCLIEVGDVSLIFEINKHQLQMIRDRLQELEDQELAEQQRLEEERKQRELSLAADLTNTMTNTMSAPLMNVNDFLADPHPPIAGVQTDLMQLEPANGLPSTSS